MAVEVIVCGLPSSGNRMVKEVLVHAGANAAVMHTPRQISTYWRGLRGKKIKAVVPVRTSPFWEMSIKTNKHEAGYGKLTLLDILNTLRALELEYMVVTYEGFLMYPSLVTKAMLGFLNLPRPDALVPFPVIDGNLKYEIL